MFDLFSLVNSPIDSITYILSNPINKEAVIIDPGTDNDMRVKNYLEKNNLVLKFIFLTHEHFDHILGVNFLRNLFEDAKVVSSQKTSDRLANPRKNLAYYYNQTTLVVEQSDIIIEEGLIKMIDLNFEVFQTQGHTDSSISLKVENSFFSGDFLLKGTRTVTNLPTGSKEQYQKCLKKYSKLLQDLTIFPGHGDFFKLTSVKN